MKWPTHLHILLADGQLAGVGEVHEESEGEGVHAVDGHLRLARLRHVVCEVERSYLDTLQPLLTVEHGVEVRAGGGQHQLVSGQRDQAAPQLHVAQLRVEPHAVHGREPADRVALHAVDTCKGLVKVGR